MNFFQQFKKKFIDLWMIFMNNFVSIICNLLCNLIGIKIHWLFMLQNVYHCLTVGEKRHTHSLFML